MGTTQPVARFTYEDYRTTPADERYELLDGDLIMAPAPNLKHQRVQFRLGRRLGQFIEERALGEFFFAPCDVVLADTDVVQPDLLFVSRDREHLLRGGDNVRGAPDLVVEILSRRRPSETGATSGSSTRDTAWRSTGWSIRQRATVSLHCRRGGALTATLTFGRGETLRSPLLAGLNIDLDDIFSS